MMDIYLPTVMDLSNPFNNNPTKMFPCSSTSRRTTGSGSSQSSIASSSSSNSSCFSAFNPNLNRNDEALHDDDDDDVKIKYSHEKLPKSSSSPSSKPAPHYLPSTLTTLSSLSVPSFIPITSAPTVASYPKKESMNREISNDTTYHSSLLVSEYFHNHYPDVLSTISKRSKSIPLPIDYEITEWDITSGRGKGSYNRIANQRFRSITESFLLEYNQCRNKVEKSAYFDRIVIEILERHDRKVHDQTGGGIIRFVKYYEEEKRWYEMSSDQARDKVGRAMRVAAAATTTSRAATAIVVKKKLIQDSSRKNCNSNEHQQECNRGNIVNQLINTDTTRMMIVDDDASALTTTTGIHATDAETASRMDTNIPTTSSKKQHNNNSSSASQLLFLQQKENEFLQRQLFLLRNMKEQQQKNQK